MKKTKISPRKSPRQGRSRSLVEHIVTATARVLTVRGYAEATTNRIAEAAGVSIGSLYQYFPSKEALAAAVLDQVIERNTRRIERELEKLKGRPIEEALRFVVSSGFDIYLSNRKLLRILFEQTPQLERVQHVFRARRRVGALLGSLLESYGIRPRSVELSTFVLLNIALGVITAALFDEPEGSTREELLDETVRAVAAYVDVLAREG